METKNIAGAEARYHLLAKGGAVALSLVLASSCVVPSIALAETANTQAQTQATQQQGDAGQPPALPSGEAPSGDAGGAPDAQGGAPGGQGEAPGMPGGGGADTQQFDYSGSYFATLNADGQSATAENQTVEATDSLTNAALVQNGGELTIKNSTLKKSGDATDGDSCNFYGVNSVLLAVGENSTATISDSNIEATSEGSNGIFATDNATVYANKVSISTTQGNSRGLDATYGGTIVANEATINTQGDHCAAFATDRGGGNISVANSQVSTQGSGSPLVYSTGTIEVNGVEGTASGSQIAGMEGLNTIRINDSTLESTITGRTASDPVANGVIIYQSTSGDADTSAGSVARFEATDSTLKSAIQEGSMFYLTNTTANVVLQNTTLDFDSSAANLVTAEGNSSNNWGSAGSNGATVNFTGIGQTLEGNAVADTISTLNMYLLDGTTWTGTAQIEQNSAGSTSEAPLTVNVSADSTWVVTDSCTVSNLNAEEGAKIVDASGNTVTIVANGETVVQGTGDTTVTVSGTYSNTVETGEDEAVSATTIDRTAFDTQFGTSTASATSSTSGSTANSEQSGPLAWLGNAWSSFMEMLGL